MLNVGGLISKIVVEPGFIKVKDSSQSLNL